MKKVMLIGALMVLSGLPNIYASEPMESEDMGMESRDFPTITSVQRVIEGNNQETQKILPFEDEIKKMLLREMKDYPTIFNPNMVSELNKIQGILEDNQNEKNCFRLDSLLFQNFLEGVQTEGFTIDLLSSASGEYYEVSQKVITELNSKYKEIWTRKLEEIKDKNAQISTLESNLRDQQTSYISQLTNLQNQKDEIDKRLKEREAEIAVLESRIKDQKDLIERYRKAMEIKTGPQLPDLEPQLRDENSNLRALLLQLHKEVEHQYLCKMEQPQKQEEEKPQKEDQ